MPMLCWALPSLESMLEINSPTGETLPLQEYLDGYGDELVDYVD